MFFLAGVLFRLCCRCFLSSDGFLSFPGLAMFAPSQQSMSAAEQQKTWLSSVAFTSATMEAVEKHAIDKNQRANSEDTHLKQM